MEKSNLEKINKENLLQGKDSDGANMPRYRDPDYANFKTQINPQNRGYWDLKLSGEYYRGIEAVIYPTRIFFKQRFDNEKIQWIHSRIGTSGLGITKDQLIDVQIKNIPKIKKQIEKLINGV